MRNNQVRKHKTETVYINGSKLFGMLFRGEASAKYINEIQSAEMKVLAHVED